MSNFRFQTFNGVHAPAFPTLREAFKHKKSSNLGDNYHLFVEHKGLWRLAQDYRIVEFPYGHAGENPYPTEYQYGG